MKLQSLCHVPGHRALNEHFHVSFLKIKWVAKEHQQLNKIFNIKNRTETKTNKKVETSKTQGKCREQELDK